VRTTPTEKTGSKKKRQGGKGFHGGFKMGRTSGERKPRKERIAFSGDLTRREESKAKARGSLTKIFWGRSPSFTAQLQTGFVGGRAHQGGENRKWKETEVAMPL